MERFMLFNAVNWEEIIEEIDELVEEGFEDRAIDAAVRALIRKRADQVDLLVDFDAMFNGKAEIVGDTLEALDGFLIRTALTAIYKLRRNKLARMKRRFTRLGRRWDRVGDENLKAKIAEHRKALGAAILKEEKGVQ